MKKIIILTLFIISSFQINAQTTENSIEIKVENIIGKWEFFDLINPKFTKEEYEETKEMLEATTLLFNKDMTYTFSFIIDLEGTWNLEKNIIITKDRRGTTNWKIHKITNSKLHLSRNDAEQIVIFRRS